MACLSRRPGKRGLYWYVDYKVGKKRMRKSFGKNKKCAEVFLKHIEVKMALGEELRPSCDPISLQDFVVRYLEYAKLNTSVNSYRTNLSRIRVFKRFLQGKGIDRLEDITPLLIEKFKATALRQCCVTTYNHYLILLKAMLNKAVEWRHLRENQLRYVKKVKSPDAKQVRFLRPEETDAILDKADGVMRRFIKILLYTGMRRSELVFLSWDDIDFRNKLVTVQSKPEAGFHPKSYRPRSIPMNPHLEQLLLDLPQKGKYLFDDGNDRPLHGRDWFTVQFDKIAKAANVRNASLHTLRHTFASDLVMAGVHMRIVQELLGHANLTTTERYAHLAPEHKLKAVSILRFGSTVTNPSQNQG